MVPSEPPSSSDLKRAADPHTLLPGEDPESGYVEDALHWIRVYGELVSVKMALLERSDQMLQGVSDDAIAEADLDHRLLRAQADRYSSRREYWCRRAKELTEGTGQRGAGDPTARGDAGRG